MSLLRTVTKSNDSKSNRYESLNFKRNPFPRKPSITVNSSDDRENGSIYVPSLRLDEIESFKKIVIPTADGQETKNVSFLMDYATRQGRGIGKTSFLIYQRNLINKDLGDEITAGTEVLFSVYCSPVPGGNYKKFSSLTKLILKNLIEQKIIKIATCRLILLSNILPVEITANITWENIDNTLCSNQWIQEQLNAHGHFWNYTTTPFKALKRMLEDRGVDSNFADMISRFGVSDSDFMKLYYDAISESIWRKEGNEILYNSIVIFLREAGFTKGIILFDELEKIIQPQNSLDRRSFCDELRYWFVDGDNFNASNSFLNILLVIHPYIQELLNPHWNASGLERFSSLGGHFDDQSTIFFKAISDEQAIPLAIEYMNQSRIENNYESRMKPFEGDALAVALSKTYNVPGKFLSFLYQLIEKAIDENWEIIDKQKVEDLSLALSKDDVESDLDNDISESKVTI